MTFVQRRRDGFPAWAASSRFDHFYRLAVNSRLAGDFSFPGQVGRRYNLGSGPTGRAGPSPP